VKEDVMERQVQSLKLETFADGVLLSNPGDPEQQTVFVSKDLIDILIKVSIPHR